MEVTGVVTTPASGVRNLRKVVPDMTSGAFVYKTNHFVVKNGVGQFEYYAMGAVSRRIDSHKGIFYTLPSRPPVIADGLLLLANRVVLAVTADDVIRGRVNKSRTQSSAELRKFVYGNDAGRGSTAGTAGQTGTEGADDEPWFDTANLQSDLDEGLGEDSEFGERSEADMAVENQISAIFFAENPQALRRISDLAHSQQAAAGRAVSDT